MSCRSLFLLNKKGGVFASSIHSYTGFKRVHHHQFYPIVGELWHDNPQRNSYAIGSSRHYSHHGRKYDFKPNSSNWSYQLPVGLVFGTLGRLTLNIFLYLILYWYFNNINICTEVECFYIYKVECLGDRFSIVEFIKSDDLQISINNIVIERVKSTKFLGIMIDDNLNWKVHIFLM